jgi:hypothetical protein
MHCSVEKYTGMIALLNEDFLHGVQMPSVEYNTAHKSINVNTTECKHYPSLIRIGAAADIG